jgi:hypothetical protein
MRRDRVTTATWVTKGHNDDKRKDDYHREVKKQIIADLEPKLRKQFGDNCDIEIDNGEIIIISQRYDEQTGKKSKKEKNTRLPADRYFDKVISFILTTIEKITFDKLTILVEVDRDKEKRIVVIIIYLGTPD